MMSSTEATPFLSPAEDDLPELDDIEASFWAFHLANPEVYAELRDLALRLRRQGRKHYGIKALYEIVRFQRVINTRSSADWKLNNDFTCMYARLLMQNEPDLRGFFRTRRRLAPSQPRRLAA